MTETDNTAEQPEQPEENEEPRQEHTLLDIDGNPFPFTPGAIICGCIECRPGRDGTIPKGPKTSIRLMAR